MNERNHTARTTRTAITLLLGAALSGATAIMPGTWTGTGPAPIAYAADPSDAPSSSSDVTLLHNGIAASHQSLEEALGAAVDGDTLQLDSDITVSQPIATDKALSIDLAGHTLSANVGAQGKSGAIRFTGSGTLSLLNSKPDQGSLDITVGNPAESAKTAGAYRGIAATADGSIALSDIAANVSYTGKTTYANPPKPTLYGIAANKGSVSLSGRTSLSVKGSDADNGFGAHTVIGIRASAADASANVRVSKESSVKVVNTAKSITTGHMQVPDSTQDGLNFNTVSDLIQIFPDKNSKFYKEICDKFKQQAVFDDSAEASMTNESSDDSEMYYAAPLVLESGVAVWAFSDPVASNKGSLDNVVPTRFFVQSYYEQPTSAYGIASTAAFTGTVQVDGQISASCQSGDAYALDAEGDSTWDVSDQANLTGTPGTGEYRARGGAIDPKAYFPGFKSSSDDLPGKRAYCIVYNAKPQGGSAFVSGKSSVTIGDALQKATDTSIDFKNNGLPIDDKTAADTWTQPDLTVTFDNIRDASGKASKVVSDTKAAFGKTLKDSHIELPATAETYTDNGVTYRFVGWSNNAVYDANDLYNSTLMNGAIAGATSGNAAVKFDARYVEVPQDKHLVKFKIQNAIVPCVTEQGKVPSYQDAAGISDTATGEDRNPSPATKETGYTYTFKGWQKDGKGEVLTELPKAKEDVTYTAVFDKTPTREDVTLGYRNKKGAWTTTGLKVPYWTTSHKKTTETNVNSSVARYAKKGTVIKTATEVYTFTGWGPRNTDTAPLWAPGNLPSLSDYDNFSTKRNRFYAKYQAKPRKVSVTYMVDGKRYAKTAKALATTTDFDTALASTGKKSPADKSKTQQFLGWSLRKNGKTIDVGKTNAATLSSLVKGTSDKVTLYAVFNGDTASKSGATKAASKHSETARAKKFAQHKAKTAQRKASARKSSAARKYAKPASPQVAAASVAAPHVSAPAASAAKKAAAAKPKPATAKKAAKAKVAKAKTAKAQAAAKAKNTSTKSKDRDKAKAAAAAKTGSNNAGGNGDGSTPDTAQVDSTVTDSGTGNVVGFAAVVAVAAAILARAIWFFVKRRRGDDDEDADGIMADEEKVTF